jgi:hypothetical protein
MARIQEIFSPLSSTQKLPFPWVGRVLTGHVPKKLRPDVRFAPPQQGTW